MSMASLTEGGARLRAAAHLLAVVAAVSGAAFIGSGLWIQVKARVAQYLLERAFSESVKTGQAVKPWRWADTWPVARISVPRLKQNVIALQGASGQALAFGPGHIHNTPAPGGAGTSVFAAHRDTQFSFLGKLVTGDMIDVTDRRGAIFHYRVTGTQIVHWDASGIDPNAAGYNLVLTTCWPLNAVTHGPLRYVVRARLVEAAS